MLLLLNAHAALCFSPPFLTIITNSMCLLGYDAYGRPVVVFDNSVQNTKDVDSQLVCLSHNLDTACRMMDPAVTDKYVVFMNLEIFSLFSCPPMKVWYCATIFITTLTLTQILS